jgi:hypothetical protein
MYRLVVLISIFVALPVAVAQEDKAREAMEKFILENTQITRVEDELLEKFFPNYTFFTVRSKLAFGFPIPRPFAVDKDGKVFGVFMGMKKRRPGTKTIIDLAKEHDIKLKGGEEVIEFARAFSRLIPHLGRTKIPPTPRLEEHGSGEWKITIGFKSFLLKLDNEGRLLELKPQPLRLPRGGMMPPEERPMTPFKDRKP